ncbi:MAG: glutamate-5-semialdehyde dehydrogenase [Planctomycetota bacterium]|nr:glutamate-5-semialdehyde dehydrogenase [Planctomycetota bacterium]
MNASAANPLLAYCLDVARRADVASAELALVDTATKNRWLLRSAELLDESVAEIVAANQKDLELAPSYGLTPAAIDRLRIDGQRLTVISQAMREIARLPDPIGEVLDGYRRPNGLEITKVRVPLGVVFFIYESRPNVTADAAAICIKSGNAVILRGGKEAIHSSSAIVKCLQSAAAQTGIPTNAVQVVETTDRDAVGLFLGLDKFIDVTIPRGGESLIRRVAAEATMPVIKHFDGNCHVYVDQSADLEMALNIIENSKCQRMGVCNALESLLVHEEVAKKFLPMLRDRLAQHKIELRGCEASRLIVPEMNAATEEDWGREYLGPILSVKVIASTLSAIEHINHYSSHHTDAIITNDLMASRSFTQAVDSAAVVVNASTRFNDGGEFGFGAEIGISTDKFHARGPCGLRELTSYKYIVQGNGQIRQ